MYNNKQQYNYVNDYYVYHVFCIISLAGDESYRRSQSLNCDLQTFPKSQHQKRIQRINSYM